MILIGTSGFSYRDWKDRFYPPRLPPSEQLSYYARHFPALEVNFTYYRLPAPGQLEEMALKAEGNLAFTVKANREMTHTGKASAGDYASFRLALEPVARRGLLGCVLAQYPWSFKPTADNRRALSELKKKLQPFPVVVEFRNSRWIHDETFRFLEENGMGYCAVDMPRLEGLPPAVARVTSTVAYVRFHGRNPRKWWKHDKAEERYDYLYTPSQLAEWVPKIREMDSKAERTFVFANNHYEGKAPVNAAMLMKMIPEAGRPGPGEPSPG